MYCVICPCTLSSQRFSSGLLNIHHLCHLQLQTCFFIITMRGSDRRAVYISSNDRRYEYKLCKCAELSLDPAVSVLDFTPSLKSLDPPPSGSELIKGLFSRTERTLIIISTAFPRLNKGVTGRHFTQLSQIIN